MRFYYDTEFYESFKKPLFGKKYHTIDLLSIAMIAEDGRELYLINKEFDVKRAWKDEWIRKNVIQPLVEELIRMHVPNDWRYIYNSDRLKDAKRLIATHGLTKEEIKAKISWFVNGGIYHKYSDGMLPMDTVLYRTFESGKEKPHEFVGYYSSYDHILISTIYGRMIDLPPGFPMYTTDLQQMIDQKGIDKQELLKLIPQENEHSALWDARWIKNAHEHIS